ncbi:MAG: protoporphyrinogen oxidase [Thermodesulfobacteriota bacterium]|nr:MAG: protoporphyrinogen oxidase [Thermodesulfobacteriota bacterium]
MKRVVIIGGGIAGLATAYSLREHGAVAGSPGFEVVLLEKKDRVGGNIRTERVDGFIVEGGPDCFISEKPWAMALCKRIGLEEKLLPTNDELRKTYVLSRGRLHELPEGVILMIPTKIIPLVTSSLISFPGKIRMGLELFIPKRKEKSDETLGDFVRRRLGREVLDKIAEPLVAGIHAGDPETMSVRASFPKFVQLEEDYGSLIRGMLKRMASFKKSARAKPRGEGGKTTMFMTLRDGMGEFIERLESLIKGFENTTVRTGTAVKGVSKKGGKFLIEIEGGEALEADSVIIAAPAYVASKVLEGLDHGLSQKLLEIPYASTATVSIAFKKKDLKRPLDGFGFVVPRKEKRRIMASTWTSVKFDNRAPGDSVLIRCFIGGSKNRELLSLSDAEMVNIVREELSDIMGIEAEPIFARVYRWINSMPQYTVGHEERVRAIEEGAQAHPGLFITGSAYHGIGIADSVRCAEVTAKKALHFIKNPS